MIFLKDRVITRGDHIEKIKCFEVWWLSISGLCTTLEEALKDAEKHEVDSTLIRPVSVAIGVEGHYEVFMR